jgi:hypothetical protein
MTLVRKIRRRLARMIYSDVPERPTNPAVESELDRIAIKARALLGGIRGNPNASVRDVIASNGPWFQRIEIPPTGITTTDDPAWALFDGAPDNTLGGRLSAREAALLRPVPKWMFIQPRLPDVLGATVLEVGSNDGFFSFEFAKLGALKVTGIEAIPEDWERSNVLLKLLNMDNVAFRLDDWCFSPDIDRHDIVFSSSVLDHLIFPFFGIYKMLTHARKFMILDYTPALTDQASCTFSFFPGHTRYHSFRLSDAMITDFLIRCGLAENAISKHAYGERTLYIVNVNGFVPRGRLESADDPQWSDRFSFDSAKGMTRKKS